MHTTEATIFPCVEIICVELEEISSSALCAVLAAILLRNAQSPAPGADLCPSLFTLGT